MSVFAHCGKLYCLHHFLERFCVHNTVQESSPRRHPRNAETCPSNNGETCTPEGAPDSEPTDAPESVIKPEISPALSAVNLISTVLVASPASLGRLISALGAPLAEMFGLGGVAGLAAAVFVQNRRSQATQVPDYSTTPFLEPISLDSSQARGSMSTRRPKRPSASARSTTRAKFNLRSKNAFGASVPIGENGVIFEKFFPEMKERGRRSSGGACACPKE